MENPDLSQALLGAFFEAKDDYYLRYGDKMGLSVIHIPVPGNDRDCVITLLYGHATGAPGIPSATMKIFINGDVVIQNVNINVKQMTRDWLGPDIPPNYRDLEQQVLDMSKDVFTDFLEGQPCREFGYIDLFQVVTPPLFIQVLRPSCSSFFDWLPLPNRQ